MSVSVSVSVSVSKLETLLHDCNSNWRRFSLGRSSVSASPRKLSVPVDRGSPYSASRVEERLSSLKVYGEGTIHTVQLLVVLPRPHSRGVHRLLGFMAQLPPPVSRVCRKSHTQRIPLADQPQRSLGVSCVSADISQVSAVHYPPTSYRLSKYHTVCRSAWLCHRLTCYEIARTHPNDADVDPNSS